jgi:hypothetical protein
MKKALPLAALALFAASATMAATPMVVVDATYNYKWSINSSGEGLVRDTSLYNLINTSITSPIPAQANTTTNIGNVGGLDANNGAVAGYAMRVGGTASSVEPTAATAGQKADLFTDLSHKLVVMPYAATGSLVSGVITSPMTATTSTLLIAAPGAGLRNYVTEISCENTSATTATLVDIQDGSGGTVIAILTAPINYGGHQKSFPAPLRQPTLNTALYVVNETTGASVKCSATGYTGI